MEKEQARDEAYARFSHIEQLVRTLQQAADANAVSAARAAIVAEAPQIAVRTNWHAPGEPNEISEYRILLSSGSPSVQVIGDIEHGEPYSARLGYQDWFTRWEECELTEEQEEMLGVTAAERKPNSRLSCQIEMKPEYEGLIVRMPERQV